MNRRLLIGAILTVVVGGGVWAYVYFDRYWPIHHFRTVEKGAFYRSGQFDGEELADAIQDYGLRTILNVRSVSERKRGDWYETEQRVAREHGAEPVDVPLKPGTPPTPEQIEILWSIFDDPKRLPVLIHCAHGTIRSSAIEGVFRCENMGETGPEAAERIETWGRDLSRDYPEIYEFIRTYVPRRDR